jgi:RimJ/RimL family protein N-acetyltransferase
VRTNEHGQPVGDPVDWTPGPPLEPVELVGRTCRLEPLGDQHHEALHAALCEQSPDASWTYMTGGPFRDASVFSAYLGKLQAEPAVLPLALLVDDVPVGVATWLRVDRTNGTAEVGHITYAASLQRTTAATEAMHLMMRHAFEVAGVRRYEWKCDALNAPSRAAAARLGFTFEGIFRQAAVYKGRTRDTAWFAVIDADWPAVRAAHERWLDPANFDEQGHQREPLRV